jgi:hypothetical protein
VRFWVEGRAVGTTQFTAQAAGYDDGVLSVRVLPSGFVHAGQGDLRLSASAPPFDRQVIPALLAQTTLDFVESQPVRPGLTVQVTVTSSDPAVAGVLGVPISVSHLSSGTYQVEPLSVGTAVLTIATPAGFDTPSERTEKTVIVDP